MRRPRRRIGVLASLPEAARLTLTWDQGSEMAFPDQTASLLRDGVFFAHPASPWQRGTNENTACCGSTSAKAPTCPSTPPKTCAPSRTGSTTGRAGHSAGAHLPRSSPPHCHHETVNVATTARIRPRTQVPRGGQRSAADDTPVDSNAGTVSDEVLPIRKPRWCWSRGGSACIETGQAWNVFNAALWSLRGMTVP